MVAEDNGRTTGLIPALTGIATIGAIIGGMAITPLYNQLDDLESAIHTLSDRFYSHSDGHPDTVKERMDGILNRLSQIESDLRVRTEDRYTKTEAYRDLDWVREELDQLEGEIRGKP